VYPTQRFGAHKTESSLNVPISFESSGLRIFAFTLHWYGIVVVAKRFGIDVLSFSIQPYFIPH
jgi:hypothetical protein